MSKVFKFAKGEGGFGMRVSEAAVVTGYSVPGGAAETAGLPIGGQIIAINGTAVNGKKELVAQLKLGKGEIAFTCTNP
eukprot:COSAG04_NODE_21403_length_374_cov_0.872727_1_plen_77_part_01